MVSVSRVMSVPVAKVQTQAVHNTIKNTVPIVGGLAVLAGSGVVDELSEISVAPLPSGADVFNDPLIDQLAYRASQVSDVGANLVEGVSDIAHGAGHIVSTIGGAALDGVDFAADCVLTAIWKPIEFIMDAVG